MTDERSRGGARVLGRKVYARVRFGEHERLEVRVRWARTKEDGLRVAVVIAELADALVLAGRRDLVRSTAKEVALTDNAKHVDKVRKAVSAIVRGATNAGAGRDVTFKQWAQRYTSGELSKLHPDHVPVKDWDDDESRLRQYVHPHVGNVPLHAFTIAHGDLVMAKLPETLAPATRRHVAQIMRRVLNLAVYPGRVIASCPLPTLWMPKLKKKNAHYTFLYPREDAKLMGHAATPLAFRLLCGVLAREGMRLAEALHSHWWQWNLVDGTFQATKTKTGDPRMWALNEHVLEVMRAWRKRWPNSSQPFADVLEPGPWRVGAEGRHRASSDETQLARRLRASLKAAGVTRAELFASTEHTRKLRVHDLRATFVTLSLAEGKTETWIRDRTGHKSTTMIDRYRRAARQVTELELGPLEPLGRVLRGLETPGGRGGDRSSKTRKRSKR